MQIDDRAADEAANMVLYCSDSKHLIVDVSDAGSDSDCVACRFRISVVGPLLIAASDPLDCDSSLSINAIDKQNSARKTTKNGSFNAVGLYACLAIFRASCQLGVTRCKKLSGVRFILNRIRS